MDRFLFQSKKLAREFFTNFFSTSLRSRKMDMGRKGTRCTSVQITRTVRSDSRASIWQGRVGNERIGSRLYHPICRVSPIQHQFSFFFFFFGRASDIRSQNVELSKVSNERSETYRKRALDRERHTHTRSVYDFAKLTIVEDCRVDR